jgi:hypothetical protein
MTISLVNEKQILDALHRLEPGRWPEVLDFIGYLQQRATSVSVQPAPLTARPAAIGSRRPVGRPGRHRRQREFCPPVAPAG